jgi:2,4-dienoyl-CoA reductase-like NADH-dependent reductase (Old Yellow Enzyme family)
MSSLTIAIGPGLLDSLKVGSLQLPNRVILAPLTRCRASEGRVPNVLMAEYYRQRASAGLIISEATAVTPMGVGYPDTPGIWSDEQVEGWQLVTEAVHSEGGRMMLQLWQVGRISGRCRRIWAALYRQPRSPTPVWFGRPTQRA